MVFRDTTHVEDAVAVVFASSSIFLFYCVYVLYESMHRLWFRKRGTILIWCYLIVSGINTCIVEPLPFLLDHINDHDNDSEIVAFRNIMTFSWLYISKFAFSILLIRVILIYINIRRVEESEHGWKSMIDPNYRKHGKYSYKEQPSWILKYYYIFGNSKYLLLFFGFYELLEVIVGLLILYIELPNTANNNNNNNINNNPFISNYPSRYPYLFLASSLMGSVILTICGYFVYNIRHSLSFDNLFISKELKKTFISSVSLICITAIGAPISEPHCPTMMQRHLIMTVPMSIFYIYSWYLCTIWVNKTNQEYYSSISAIVPSKTMEKMKMKMKNEKKIGNEKEKEKEKETQMVNVESESQETENEEKTKSSWIHYCICNHFEKKSRASIADSKIQKINRQQRPSLPAIFRDFEKYRILMTHVKKEFAMENLLFITVLLQWQDYLIKHNYWSYMQTIDKIYFVCWRSKHIKLAKDIPTSPIIYQLEGFVFPHDPNNDNNNNNHSNKNNVNAPRSISRSKSSQVGSNRRDSSSSSTHENTMRNNSNNNNTNYQNYHKKSNNNEMIEKDKSRKFITRAHTYSHDTYHNNEMKTNFQSIVNDKVYNKFDSAMSMSNQNNNNNNNNNNEINRKVSKSKPKMEFQRSRSGSRSESPMPVQSNSVSVDKANVDVIIQMENSMDFEQFRRVFIDLYENYIAAGHAPFEINISGNLRDKMTYFFVQLTCQIEHKPNNTSNNDNRNNSSDISKNNLKKNQSPSIEIIGGHINNNEEKSSKLTKSENLKIHSNIEGGKKSKVPYSLPINMSASGSNISQSSTNQAQTILDEELFVQIWNNLVFACEEVVDNLKPSIARCAALSTVDD